jgi:vancomycin resistance protein YoaR
MRATKTTKPKAPVTKAKKSTKAEHEQQPKPAKGGAKTKATNLSALDAAAKVLAETGRAMNCKELIEALAAKGYWKSPGGKTPHGTLYSALLRELTMKGADARFAKTERGKFALAEKT